MGPDREAISKRLWNRHLHLTLEELVSLRQHLVSLGCILHGFRMMFLAALVGFTGGSRPYTLLKSGTEATS